MNFVYTDLTQATAFGFREDTRDHGYGPAFDRPAAAAPAHRITAEGVELSPQFLDRIRHHNQGVILVEGRAATTAPLVLTVETGTGTALVSLPLQAFSPGAPRRRQPRRRDQDRRLRCHHPAQPFRFWINDDDDGDQSRGRRNS